MVYKLKYANRQVISVPAVRKFPGLQSCDDTREYGEWGWHLLNDIRMAFSEIYWEGRSGALMLDSTDFASLISFSAKITTNGHHAWLVVDEDEGTVDVFEDEDLALCPFERVYQVYLPAGLGNDILKLGKLGIKRMERANTASSWQAVLWDASVVDYLELRAPGQRIGKV